METTTTKTQEAIEIPEDVHTMIEKIQGDLEEYDRQTKDVCKKTGMTREQLEKFVNNPSNFTTEEWSTLQKVKTEVEDFKNKICQAVEKHPEEALTTKK